MICHVVSKRLWGCNPLSTAACSVAFAALGVAPASAEGELRWRAFDQNGTALLAIADSDATDHFGSPTFECEKGAGIATAEGDMNDDLRSTVATLILHDQEPAVALDPADSSAQSIELFFSNLTGWRYRFLLSVTGPAFDQLERTGTFQLKVGDSVMRSQFSKGLENVGKFRGLCRRPSN
jgi:hypothetical protein